MFKELEGGMKGAIDRALKYGNLQYKIPCAIFYKLGYSNHELQDLEVRNKVYRYLKKHYSKFIDSYACNGSLNTVESNDVWICWLQGMEKAPDIVKACYRSIKKWIPNKTIHVIDENNLFNYIDLPKHVIDKWEKGLISNTLFSDFIRLSVLTRFGGIWMDATVLMTGPLPNYVNRSHLFMYKCNDYDITKFGESWFIKAEAHNFVMEETLKLMCEYWRKENKIRDYFQMFLFMKMVVEKYPDTIYKMIKIPNNIPQMLQKYLNDPFDAKIYDDICMITNIHKLTYKNLSANSNAFWEFIIKQR